ncbi:MAG: PP2C family protein-serine/threonine phosphatase [Oligoflexus sp.]
MLNSLILFATLLLGQRAQANELDLQFWVEPADFSFKLRPPSIADDAWQALSTETLPQEKHAIIWVKLRLPELKEEEGLKISSGFHDLQVFIEDQMLYEYGKIERQRFGISPSIWHYFELLPEDSNRYLYIRTQLLKPYYVRIPNFQFGERTQIEKQIVKQEVFVFAAEFTTLVIGLLAIIYYFVNRPSPLYLHSGWFNVCTSIWRIFNVDAELKVFIIPFSFSWSIIDLVALYMGTFFFCMFCQAVARHQYRPIMRRLALIYLCFPLICFSLELFRVLHLWETLFVFHMIAIASVVIQLSFVIISAIQGSQNARIFLVGNIFVVLSATIDIMAVWLHWGRVPLFLPYGSFAFQISMIMIMFRGYSREKEKRFKTISDMQAAREVQLTILPPWQAIPGLDFTTFYRSADQTSGDWFYFYHDAPRHRTFFVIADVIGHGLPAALISAMLGGSIKGQLTDEVLMGSYSSQDILLQLASRANVVVYDQNYSGKMVTAAFLAIDSLSAEAHYLNAGHTPLFHKSGKQFHGKALPGSPLGLNSKPKHRVLSFNLQAGDLLFLYTDGLFENGGHRASFKERSLMRELSRFSDPLELKLYLHEKIDRQQVGTSLTDDCTFMVIRFAPETHCSILPVKSS